MMLFNKITSIGLDISDYILRCVLLSKRRDQIFLESFKEERIESKDQLTKIIEKIVKGVVGRNSKNKSIKTVLPDKESFIKLLRFDNKDNLENKIREEIVKHIPFSVDEVYIDWQILKEGKVGEPIETLVGASPKIVVDEYLNLITSAHLICEALEIEAQSISRSIFKNNRLSSLIIDLGKMRSNLILSSPDAVVSTFSIPFSGENNTQIISSNLNLTYDQGEKAKILCGLDENKCQGSIKNILAGELNSLMKNITDALSFYEAHFPSSPPITQIILTGGGANFKHIDKLIEENTKIKVSKANPLVNLAPTSKLTSETSVSWATAIGLALNGLI